jgi:hypothetical protein
MSKFEQLLDLLVNEEHEKANELFHEIVVEKSREIYENLIAEEAKEEEDEDDEEQDESMEDESVEEAFGMEDEESEESDDDEVGGDATDDFVSDVESPDDEFGGEEGGDETPATKADVQDLEDALEELKSEFERLMNAEEAEEEENPGVHGDASLGGEEGEESDDAEDEEDDEEEFESLYNESRQLTREYREKVATPSMTDGGGVGSGTGDKAGQTGTPNTKSPVSSGAGKPTSGASAKNIAQGGKGVGEMDGTRPNAKGPAGVLKAGGDFVPAGTKNVSASSTSKMPDGAKLSGVSKPAMKKEGEGVGAGRGDKAGQTGSVDTRSPTDRKF